MFNRPIKSHQNRGLLKIPIFFTFLYLLLVQFFVMLMPSEAFAKASICGYVFFDANQNGVKDDGELTRANHIVYLDDFTLMFAGKGGSFSTVTDADGKFCFVAQSVGGYGYYLRTEIPEGMQSLTTPLQSDLKTGVVPPHVFQVSSSSQQVEVDFGFYGAVSDAEPIWNQCQTDEEKDNSVCVHNNQYAMQVTPDNNATEKEEPMQIETIPHEAYGDIYVGDNMATEVFTGERSSNLRSTRSQEDSEQFFITVGKNISATGEEEELEAFINPDDSISFIDPETPSLTLTLHEDNTFTATDSNSPDITVSIDESGDLSAIDAQLPTMGMFISAATGDITITDTEYDSTTATVNPNGSLTVVDEAFPELIATVYEDGTYEIEDTIEEMVVQVDALGNYTVIDGKTNTCVVVPKTRGFFGDLWKKIKNVFKKITSFIKKIAGFVSKVFRFVARVAPVISAVFKAISAVAQIAATAFPLFCKFLCAVAGFADAIAGIVDKIGEFALKVARIAEGIESGSSLAGMWTRSSSDDCVDTRRKIRESDLATAEGIKESSKLSRWETISGSIAKLFNAKEQLTECKDEKPSEPSNETNSSVSIFVNIAGDGKGQVMSTPSGINCFDNQGSTCSLSFINVNRVTLNAVPENNSEFKGWEGACDGLTSPCVLDISLDTNISPLRIKAKFSLSIIPREEWSDTKPKYDEMTKLLESMKPKGIIVHHSGNSGEKTVQGILKKHLKTGFGDVGYNFLIEPDGTIYEGRSLDYEAAHTFNYNREYIGILVLGDFQPGGLFDINGDDKPTTKQISSLKSLSKFLKDKYPTIESFFGHKDTETSEDCPGEYLEEYLPKIRKELGLSRLTRSDYSHILEVNLDNCLRPPFAVLDYLTVSPRETGNLLTWETVVEIDNTGFNVYRATQLDENGEPIDKILLNNALIPAQPDSRWGAQYSFMDENVPPNTTLYYVIEDVDTLGIQTLQLEDIAKAEAREPAQAACQLYGVHDEALNNSIFFVYNAQDNTTTQIGEICEGCDIEAMDISPQTNEIYVASGNNTYQNPQGQLYKLTQAGELISVGASGFKDISSLAFDKNNVLWSWAKGHGLIQLNSSSGQGTLITPSQLAIADLTWDLNSEQLYAAMDTELWSYNPTSQQLTQLCSNLPKKVESLEVLPSHILPAGYVLLGSHQGETLDLHAFNVETCQIDISLNVLIDYDDPEGLAMPTCSQ